MITPFLLFLLLDPKYLWIVVVLVVGIRKTKTQGSLSHFAYQCLTNNYVVYIAVISVVFCLGLFSL